MRSSLIACILVASACSYMPPRSGELGDAGADGDTTDGGDIIVTGDGGVDPPDAPPGVIVITLAQTSGSATAQAIGCTINGGQTISDSAWYRVFPLADYGVTGPFTLTRISFWVWKTQGTRVASLSVGTYAGTFQSAAFQPSQFQVLHQGNVTAPVTTPNGQLVTIALATPLVFDPATTPQIAIKLSTSNLLLGSNGGPQSAHGYFGSSTCNQSTATPPQTGSFFILTAEGTMP